MKATTALAIVGRDADLDALVPALAARGLRLLQVDDDLPRDEALMGVIAAAATPDDLRRWRADGVRCPILCLARTDAVIAAEQLEAGADALLIPPLTADAVALQLAVAARRRAPPRLRLADRIVDLHAGRVVGPDGEIDLTPTELRLLAELHAAAGRPVPRSTLLRRAWGFSRPPRTRAVDHAVRRLRTKIEIDPAAPRHLLTAHRVGYRLRVPGPGAEATPRSRPRNTPLQLALHGRGTERAAADAALARSGVCWLWGPAGAGKSRLAAEVAGDDATGWISAVGARTADGLCVRIAAALDIALPARSTLADLGHALAGQGAVTIVVDGLEHTAPALHDALCAALGAWRRVAPRCRVLVTARRRATLPDTVRLGPLDARSAQALFLDVAARHGALPADAAERADAIVGHLDRLPQTLLLVAGRLRYGSLHALCHAFERDPGLGAGGASAAFDRTWDHLDRWRRALLTAAALFVGDFDLAALDDIDPVPELGAPDTATLVDGLVDVSLIEQAPGTPARLRLLPSVRASVRRRSRAPCGLVERYARRRIEQAEHEAAGLVTVRAGAAARALIGSLPTLDALIERDDIDPALRARALHAVGELLLHRSVISGQADRIARARRHLAASGGASTFGLAIQQACFLRLGGRVDAAAEVLDSVPPEGVPAEHVPRHALEQARLALWTHRLDDARQAIDTGLAAAFARDDRVCVGELLDRAATIARRQGRLADAEALCERAVVALRGTGAVWPELVARGNRALVLLARGDAAGAEAIWSGLVEQAVEVDDRGVELSGRSNLGAALLARGLHADAAHHLQLVEVRATAAGLRNWRMFALYHLGRLRLDRGDAIVSATGTLDEALALADAVGDRRLCAAITLWRGCAHHLAGRVVEAEADYAACAAGLAGLGPELLPLWAFARRRLTPGVPPIPDGPDLDVSRALRALDGGARAEGHAALARRSIELRMAARLAALDG